MLRIYQISGRQLFLVTLGLAAFFIVNIVSVNHTLAASFELSGTVNDSTGNGIPGATIVVINTNTSANVASVTTDSFGNYSASVDAGVYNIQVTPPSSSSFGSAVAPNRTISANTVINFILVDGQPVSFSGHIYDSLGNPVANQRVSLIVPQGIVATATTNTAGEYSMIVSSGSYLLQVASTGSSSSTNLPPSYTFETPMSTLSLTQSTVLDVTLPFKRVDAHVQSATGDLLSDVEVRFNQGGSVGNLVIPGITTNAQGTVRYSTPLTTNVSGDATFWLFPNLGDSTSYMFTATPPAGSIYGGFSLSNVFIADNQDLVITLPQPLAFSGHIYDSLGNPVADQRVSLIVPQGVVAAATTNTSGEYSMTVSPGSYLLQVANTGSSSSTNLPPAYTFDTPMSALSLTQSTILDVTLPFKRIDAHVQNAAGDPLSDVTIQFNQGGAVGNLVIPGVTTNAQGTVHYYSSPITNASGDATFWLFPNLGDSTSYMFTATPPTGSIYGGFSLNNVFVANDQNIVITLPQPLSFFGRIFDSLGNPAANQKVSLFVPQGSVATAITDASGSYSMLVSPGSYLLSISSPDSLNPSSSNLPPRYTFETPMSALSLTQNTVLDITLPFKRVDVHVQNFSESPISGTKIQPIQGGAVGNLVIPGVTTNAQGSVYYTSLTTNASGDATFWLFPNSTTNTSYTFIATPPTSSIYGGFTLSNVFVANDQTIVISLQYSHDRPLTTVTLSPPVNGDYPDPTEVTLSATAASGYSIADTYYTIDGGTRQDYAAPFTVSGNGDHVITFWSVDNAGVPEASNVRTFTIKTNNSPVFDAIGNKTVSEGQLLQFAVSASDPDGDNLSYSATNLPQGATFDSQTRVFSWQPDYNQGGNYENIEFTVMDDGSPIALDVELVTITVGDVNRPPMFIDASGPQEVLSGSRLTFVVNAVDPDNNAISLSSSNLPVGATFDASTGVFSWTPSSTQEGFRMVTFTATDDGTPIETSSFDVVITVGHNPTPVEQADSLVNYIITADISNNIENSYLANLQKVAIFIEQGKIQPAINQLVAFVQKVEQDYMRGAITLSQRDSFIEKAQRLIDVLSGN